MSRPRRQAAPGALEQPVLLHELQSLGALLLSKVLQGDPGDALHRCVSPRLIRSGARIELELAWAVLQAFMSQPLTWPADSAASDADRMEEALLTTFFRAAPPLAPWAAYLSQFPPGDALLPYREERSRSLWQWLPHVHPTGPMLMRYAKGYADSDSLCRAIAAHIEGPYTCASCRMLLAGLSENCRAHEWTPAARLAAASSGADLEWSTNLVGDNGERLPCMVRWVDDGGFLHAFISLADTRSPKLPLEVTACFETGALLRAVITDSDSESLGINCGGLGPLSLEQMVGFYLGPAGVQP